MDFYKRLNENNPFLHSSGYLNELLKATHDQEDVFEIMTHIERHDADEVYSYAEVLYECHKKLESIERKKKWFQNRNEDIMEIVKDKQEKEEELLLVWHPNLISFQAAKMRRRNS
ncbi:hypothetical protein GCM10008967_00500 [Bacillus carboniphilus]|uniref:Uncharacterized protein n=1 Tax=Bacillus carboniphilus TaxID=86663 RepID=A0ABN0VPB1_9BACI